MSCTRWGFSVVASAMGVVNCVNCEIELIHWCYCQPELSLRRKMQTWNEGKGRRGLRKSQGGHPTPRPCWLLLGVGVRTDDPAAAWEPAVRRGHKRGFWLQSPHSLCGPGWVNLSSLCPIYKLGIRLLRTSQGYLRVKWASLGKALEQHIPLKQHVRGTQWVLGRCWRLL